MKKTFVALFLALSLAPLPALGAEKPISVVATFSILGDLTKQVGGDFVEVKTLVGPDGDAHTYNPTPKDSKALAKADLVIENGLHMEGWLQRLVSASGFKGTEVIASEGIVPRQMEEEGSRVTDPHAWQNVANARIYAQNIAKALEKALPKEAPEIQKRAKAYDEELATLDTWVKSELSAYPETQRKIITSHDAFGYFGAAYHVTFLAPAGLSTEVEPTAAQVAKLIGQMKAEKVSYVFFENMTSPKLVQQLAKDAHATVGSPIYSDALSKEGGPAPTYTSMIRYNMSQFKMAMAQNGK